MIKCILFDVGGVLFLPGTSLIFSEKMEELYGIDKDTVHAAFKKHLAAFEKDEIDPHTFWRSILKELGLPRTEEEHVKEIAYKKDHLNTAVMTLAQELKKNFIVGLLTNNNREQFMRHLREEHIEHIFDPIFTSYELKLRKPDPHVYEIVLQKLKLRPNEIVFVDDDPDNIASANHVGLHGIVYSSFEQMKQDLKQLGVLEK